MNSNSSKEFSDRAKSRTKSFNSNDSLNVTKESIKESWTKADRYIWTNNSKE